MKFKTHNLKYLVLLPPTPNPRYGAGLHATSYTDDISQISKFSHTLQRHVLNVNSVGLAMPTLPACTLIHMTHSMSITSCSLPLMPLHPLWTHIYQKLHRFELHSKSLQHIEHSYSPFSIMSPSPTQDTITLVLSAFTFSH